ncbi:MAG: hypothetical protein IKE73_05085, partial [Bacilli bacterium]|nr:hypothetical protein [Bacilli bacterium]
IVFKNSGGQAGTNTNYAIIISGNYTDDELIKLVATGYGRNTKLVYCKKDDEVNNCYPPVAYGVQFNQEAPFFAEKDEKNIDDEIDPGVLAIDSYKESGKTKKGSLYSILMNFSEDSENILESFDGGNKPSKNYGEYIIYMASKDAWLKKVKETSNKSEVAQERVRKVFKLWWNHVKYYSLPSFFSTDRAEEGYSDIAAKMKIEGEGEDKKYTFDGNLDDYEFFTFSKFYYNNDSTYKTMVESTIKYIGSIIQTNNLNEMDDKYKKMDTNKYLKEYRKKYISCFAVPGNAVYEACGNPPFTGQTTIDTCTDKINEMMENDNSDTCISRASEQYWDLINLTNSNNNLNRNDLDELFYQSAASSMEKTYRDCLKELLKNKYPGLTEEQFNTCNTKLESDKTTASGIDEDYKDAYDFKKKLESEIRLNWNDGEIDITQGTEIEIDCSKLEPFRDIWVIVIRSAPFLLILFGSIDYFKVVTAGDPDSIKKAKKQFKTRLLAFVLLLVIPFVIKFILNTFGTRGAQSIETMRCIVDGE